ncbi:hypothetical protein AQJ58_02340 [Streptomyces sp. DSM 15324]|nr:hypothetical protein AQJ58_02340 [Streptomyces sp. DSM 15324]
MFSLGVASGAPLPEGIVLWTRLAPDPLHGGGMPRQNVAVQWEISPDSRFASSVRRSAPPRPCPRTGTAFMRMCEA